MIRDIGLFKLRLKKLKAGDGPQTIASYHLSFTFGWIPLISDLRRLADFANQTDKVLARLEKLYSGKGLRRRLEKGLGSDTKESVTNNIAIESAHGEVFFCSRKTFTTARRWATVRWRPTTVPKRSLHSEYYRRLALRTALGLNLQTVYLWNAVPWSWLVDWFTNVGDYLSTHSNVIPAVSGPVNLMTYTKTTAVFTRTDNLKTVIGGEGVWIHESKIRTIGTSGTLVTELPFLDARKLSILAALAIQRSR